MVKNPQHRDEDAGKGAVEQNRPNDPTNLSFSGQNAHRDQDPLLKSNDTDFPERGQNEEHTGEPQGRDQLRGDTTACDPESATQDQEPGFRQKENQNKSKDDSLAA